MIIDDPREPVEGTETEDLDQDQGGELPEADQDDGTDTTSDQEPTEQPAGGRAERREDHLRTLANEAREARETADRARRDLEDYQRRLSQPPPPDLNAMDPESRLRYEADQRFASLRNENLSYQFRTQATLDKMAFDQAINAQPGFRKYADQVEQHYQVGLQNAMRQGRPDLILSRDLILNQIYGADMRKNGEKALKTARENGQRNIQKQTTRTGNISGNVRPSKQEKDPAQAALERLMAAGRLEK
jgi:hypothetical protein